MTIFNKKVVKGLPVGIKVRKPRYYYQDIIEKFNESTEKGISLTKFEGLEYDFDGGLISFKSKKLWNGITSSDFEGFLISNDSEEYFVKKDETSFVTVRGCLAENVKIYPTVGATLSAFVKGNEILLDNKDIDKEGYIWAGQYSIPSFTYKLLYKPDFNMVGNVTMNSDGSYSGFSGSNYISFDKSFEVGSNTWEVVAKFTTTNSFPSLQGIYHFHNALSDSGRYGLIIRMQGNKFNFVASSGYSWLFNATGSYTIQPNTTYWVKVSFDGSKYVLSYSLDGETYIEDIVQSSTSLLLSGLDIMVAGTWYSGSSYIEPLLGKLYLNSCYWKIGDEVYSPMKVVDKNPSYFPDNEIV